MRSASGAAPRPFPWAEALGFGLGVLRLDPRAFWSMTPRELAAAYRGLIGNSTIAAMPRSALDALLSQFPDHMESTNGEIDE